MTELSQFDGAEPIAIIGMAVRVPGASDVAAFWRNLIDGVESVTVLSRDQLLARGVDEAEVDDPSYVPAAHVFDEMEYFDADLFGMTAREADLSDPQLRVFLEQSHAALLDAGYDPGRYRGDIGVYAGAGAADYHWLYLRRNRRAMAGAGELTLAVGNHSDYIATTVSYRLNLRGPALTLHTACSSSLVAVHLAAEALRGGECDMALAGGVSVDLPYGQGYPSSEGFLSPDGHCRPFDAEASGTMWGSGVGVVVLKRLSDALADRDTVHGLLLGNAINNDGASKVGFSAPSVVGQAEVIRQALGVAGVDPRTIGYVEAHGTGTALGDPLEVAALNQVYTEGTGDRGWCGLGSVKSNLGHLSQAAGVVGLVKAVLALKHGIIPPTVNFASPNPRMDIDSTAFYIASTLSKWDSNGTPRRAAVSSFGIGGTNAHAVLQEPPHPVPAPQAQPDEPQLLQLSARTPAALAASIARLADRLRHGDDNLADVAYTLRAGRPAHRHRAALVATDLPDAAAGLADAKRVMAGEAADPAPPVAMLFSGQGAQYAGMGAQLYRTEPVFATAIDECALILQPELGEDLRDLLFPAPDQRAAAEERLRQTALTQPALFAIEYALAVLWRSWGVTPAAMIGHSIGEYVAATLAGVFSVADALRLVATRGRLMQSMPPGAMVAVQRGEQEIGALLPDQLRIAVVNGPGTCVVAGPLDDTAAFAEQLRGQGIGCTMLRTSHAFHTPMMSPILADFAAAVAAVPRHAPTVPFLSNVTGDWITDEQAVDPEYWANHLRQAVRFGDCVTRLIASGRAWKLVECGPGRQLAGLVRMQLERGASAPLHSLPGPADRVSDLATIKAAAAQLWVAGLAVDINAGQPAGRRVSLPGYPYERRYHWIPADAAAAGAQPAPRQRRKVDDWFEVPAWRQLGPQAPTVETKRCLVFAAEERGEALAKALRDSGVQVIVVRPSATFAGVSDGFQIRVGLREDYDQLLAEVRADGSLPDRIVHAWSLARDDGAAATAPDLGFYSLLWLAQALASAPPRSDSGSDTRIRLDVVTAGTLDVRGGDLTDPVSAMVTGVVQVAPLEIPGLDAVQIDLDPAGVRPPEVLAQLGRPITTALVALRGGRRWIRTYEPAAVASQATAIRDDGRYLITGGLGGIGITVAEHLGTRHRTHLILLARTDLPPRAEWDAHLAVHGERERIARAITAIRRIEAAGSTVHTVAGDVTDAAAMRRVREELIARFGGIDGIVHAAGLPGGGMIEVKERSAAEQVIAPKVAGTIAIVEAFRDLPMDFVALCSSVTGIAGDLGQVDYCAANAFLDAYAACDHGMPAHVVSINWGGWRDVGMAAETAVPAAFQALQHGRQTSAMNHPVLTELTTAPLSAGEPVVARGRISPHQHWVLDEHRIGTVAVLPGTAHLEVIRAGFAAAVPAPDASSVVELRDVVFLEPLAVPDRGAAELRIMFSPTDSASGDGANLSDSVDFEVAGLTGGATRTHVRGSAGWVAAQPPPRLDISQVQARCTPAGPTGSTTPAGGRTSILQFGPRWSCLATHHVGDGEELALIEATDQVTGELGDWFLHPALLDVATAFGSSRGDGAYLPIGYGRLLARKPLPARFSSYLRYQPVSGDEVISADLSLVDEHGEELVAINDFLLRRIDPQVMTANLSAPTDIGGVSTNSPADRPEATSDAAGSGGIAPAQGAEALVRLLSTADLGTQVIVSTVPIGEIIERARLVTAETVADAPTTSPSAPLLAGAHTPPRTPLEATIAEVWSAVLGVDDVGADSDFFELGGNSLVAVQLISHVRRATGVRLPMRVLFEATTVAALAARVEQTRAEAGEAASDPDAEDTVPAQATIPRLART